MLALLVANLSLTFYISSAVNPAATPTLFTRTPISPAYYTVYGVLYVISGAFGTNTGN